MAQRTKIQVRIKISTQKEYTEHVVMDRDINCDVPPGYDPIEYLTSIIKEETRIVSDASRSFPQFQALPAPEEG